MGNITDRVAKMKKRAANLHAKKVQVEHLQKERTERELQRERDLNAKPAASLSTTPTLTPDATVAVGTPPQHREPVSFLFLSISFFLSFFFLFSPLFLYYLFFFNIKLF